MRPLPTRIYLDANATTPLHPEVFDSMRPFLLESFGNASSIHQPGQRARAAVEKARSALARLLNSKSSEIVFTSGGTESDNLALFGVLNSASSEPAHLISSTIEHHAVLHAAEALARRNIEVTFLPSDAQGLISPDDLRAALRPHTRLVSIMFSNNETGVTQPIQELARVTRQHSTALFHTDAVQAAGKLPLDLSPSGPLAEVDLLALSGHKMYAPQGTGVLFVRHGIRLEPLFHGGTHERQRRAGTENVAGIVALGKAAELAHTWLTSTTASESPAYLATLRDRLEQTLLAEIPSAGLNGHPAPRTCNTTNLFFDGIDAESLVITLDLNGIAVSGGSACQSGAAEPSHVLTAMGLTPSRARSSIRISLSRFTTPDEIDAAAHTITSSVAQLRSISQSRAHTPTLTTA